MKKPAANRAEYNQRVDEVLRIRLDGAQLHDLKAYAAERQWNVSERQLFRYAKAADALIMRHAEKDREALIVRHVAQRRALYARALNSGDYGTALRVLDSECQLLGLFPKAPAAPPHPTTPWSLDRLTDEELSILKTAAERAGQVTVKQTVTELTVTESTTHEAESAAAAGTDPPRELPPELPRIHGPHVDPVRDG
jgi:hypothetical protein